MLKPKARDKGQLIHRGSLGEAVRTGPSMHSMLM
ncbi:hypothetical protein IEO21_07919 [Rhodonia placenta]|uniref:Uncharacterized protein n=1 Tax=Rhodonia placenta TaxID=104341 RepID=A0A8H7NX63_9APHY|nr:hypothetical protein IEO21_07919 [Postia placenta]